jgi:hypothetical protein
MSCWIPLVSQDKPLSKAPSKTPPGAPERGFVTFAHSYHTRTCSNIFNPLERVLENKGLKW